MFLLPPEVIVDAIKDGDGSKQAAASDLIDSIERYRHGVAPVVHGASGAMRVAFEARADIHEQIAAFWEGLGVRCLFTMAARQIADNNRALAGRAAVIELMNDPRIKKPGWEIDQIKIGDIDAKITHEDEVIDGFERYAPFMRVIKFTAHDKNGMRIIPKGDPIIVPAPNSGHPPEYIDDTVKALLESGRDVRVLACRDAMDIPVAAGKFDMDDVCAGTARVFNHYQGKFHVMPICEPGPNVAIALALMAEAKQKGGYVHLPEDRSVVWTANPMDVQVNPKEVNTFATSKVIAWFDKYARAKVPFGLGYKGQGREIYYGLGQIVAFMMRDPKYHWGALKKFGAAVADSDMKAVRRTEYFYGRRFLVPQSIVWELYRQKIEKIFMGNLLAKGEYRFTGEICGVKFDNHRVDLGKIKNMGFLSIQGEKDDITPLGQCGSETLARMFPNIKDISGIVIEGAGHTGAFRGTSFTTYGLPAALNMFEQHDSPSSPKMVSVQKPAVRRSLQAA
jgi:poly(3-hydroxybutyrate) depolymerase